MKLLLLASLALGLTLVDAYRSGVFRGDELKLACSNVYPGHAGILPKSGGPYTLTVTDDGNVKKVQISGTEKFLGFILQAKGVAGTFSSASHEVYNVPCQQGATIRHKNAALIDTLTVIWTPSAPGQVVFEGAAVKGYTEFYKLGPKSA